VDSGKQEDGRKEKYGAEMNPAEYVMIQNLE